MDGYTSDNTTDEYFVGGLLRQRTSLVQVDDIVYGGFGGHCGSFPVFNNTALIIGINVTSKEVVRDYPVQSGSLVARSLQQRRGSRQEKEDIFTTGMEISTDDQQLYLVSQQRKPKTPALNSTSAPMEASRTAITVNRSIGLLRISPSDNHELEQLPSLMEPSVGSAWTD
ncbi:hypothetical protein ABVK25_006110 [Lepraria finkii]|uniref:Uncharacterized protein n=1 Tax=Lepraria finkii TaxID=1340010 RepID=A0ABR4B6G3_9LECA